MEDLYKKELVTCEEMKELERMADQRGLSYYQMMENAGCGAANLIYSFHPQLKRLVVFCGKGNNGGDGFVVARNFMEVGIETVLVLVEGEPTTREAIENYRLLDDSVKIFDRTCPFSLGKGDVIVDAVFGTGFHGELDEFAAEVVDKINAADAFTVSLDIPSGLCGNMRDGDPLPPSVNADLTIVFHSEKPVHCCQEVEERMGDIIICDIGMVALFEKRGTMEYEDHYGDI